jgi:hypothetical protein
MTDNQSLISITNNTNELNNVINTIDDTLPTKSVLNGFKNEFTNNIDTCLISSNNNLSVSSKDDKYYYLDLFNEFPYPFYSNSDGFMSFSRDNMLVQNNNNVNLSNNNANGGHYGIYQLASSTAANANYTIYSKTLLPNCFRDYCLSFDFSTRNDNNDISIYNGIIPYEEDLTTNPPSYAGFVGFLYKSANSNNQRLNISISGTNVNNSNFNVLKMDGTEDFQYDDSISDVLSCILRVSFSGEMVLRFYVYDKSIGIYKLVHRNDTFAGIGSKNYRFISSVLYGVDQSSSLAKLYNVQIRTKGNPMLCNYDNYSFNTSTTETYAIASSKWTLATYYREPIERGGQRLILPQSLELMTDSNQKIKLDIYILEDAIDSIAASPSSNLYELAFEYNITTISPTPSLLLYSMISSSKQSHSFNLSSIQLDKYFGFDCTQDSTTRLKRNGIIFQITSYNTSTFDIIERSFNWKSSL